MKVTVMLAEPATPNRPVGAMRRSSFTMLILGLLFPSLVIPMCLSTKTRFVEIVVSSCESVEAFRDVPLVGNNRTGAVVTALVYADTEVPVGGRYGLNPDEWSIVRHSHPETRTYFFYSDKNEPCVELTNRSRLLMQELPPCCDTGPNHPDCMEDRRILAYMPDWMIELGATDET